MNKATKMLHLLGFVMFLGGILATIVTNAVVGNDTNPILIDHQRQFVSAIIRGLMIPGMWVVFLSGLFMVRLRKYNLRKVRWITIKFALALIILLNGTFILAPLANEVTALASQGASQGMLAANYFAQKANEDMFGAVNFFLILITVVFAVFKPVGKKAA